MFEYINKNVYMHAFSALLIYPSAIHDYFLFHIEHNFTLLTLKVSTFSQDLFNLYSICIFLNVFLCTSYFLMNNRA